MKYPSACLAPAFALTVSLASCSSGPGSSESEGSNSANLTTSAAKKSTAPPLSVSRTKAEGVAMIKGNAATTPISSAPVIGLEGLGVLRIGQSVPRNGSWAERGAQTNDSCRTVSSPDYPGVYAIVVDSEVRRITVGQRSDVKLAEGVGVGTTEKEVEKWFSGFRDEPHKYEAAPAKYLTAPNAKGGDAALRFEIGRNGKVSLIHVGTMPMLGYVEGCA